MKKRGDSQLLLRCLSYPPSPPLRRSSPFPGRHAAAPAPAPPAPRTMGHAGRIPIPFSSIGLGIFSSCLLNADGHLHARKHSTGLTFHSESSPYRSSRSNFPFHKQSSYQVSVREALNQDSDAVTFQQRTFTCTTQKIKRNPSFSVLSSDDIHYFKNILGDKNVIQDEDRLLSANSDWMKKYKGVSQLMLLPRNTEEVSQIIRYCNSKHLAVVPQGGNTGLVGGSVPVFDEVIINAGSMNRIISFDKVSGVLVCEAGCILENLDSYLATEGFMMPLDLGAKGSCQIGGNISTNAGGVRFIRYGSLHANILGLEVVLADGSIVDMLGTLRKDNTGYDLKHLFIGSEGSLGIVTKISIVTPPCLPSTHVAFLACHDYLSCQNLLSEAKRTLGEILSAFEFLDSHSLHMVLNHLEGVRNPLPSIYNFYVLIETTGSHEPSDKSKIDAFLLQAMEKGLILDGTVAQDINQASSFWRIREGIAEALSKAGAVYKYDLSLPLEHLYGIVEEMRIQLGEAAKVVGFGHLGDGNLHLNISAAEYDDDLLAKIEPFVYEWTSKHRGSISAEHGLGLMKADKIHYSKSPEAIQLMASLKRLLDPNGILNPYKVIPPSMVL